MVVPKPNPTKEKLLKLMSDKDKLEATINGYGEILAANDNVGMNGPLIDSEGYPRNDIDIYKVRQARQQIICLQNDHKELMKEIEKLLHKLHAETAQNEGQQQEELTNRTEEMHVEGTGVSVDADMPLSASHENGAISNGAITPLLTTIAKVNLVSRDSPSELAGLRLGDEVIQFGSINSTNFSNDLNQIGALVRNMQNRRVALKVKRDGEFLDLILIPKTWSGRGLLGCNIVLPNAMPL